VNFSAQQVTKEKQGIELKGIIIWSIFREGDGPFKAYKNLGNDLSSNEPRLANKTLSEMSNSIVRHRIANSSIEDILTKRDEIRKEIKDQMNKIVNGWGVWLESVEITDVRVLSKTLFNNLQVEFREANRQAAEIIKINTQKKLDVLSMEQKQQIQKLKIEKQTQNSIFELDQSLKVKQEKMKIVEMETKLKMEQADQNNKLNQHNNNCSLQYNLQIDENEKRKQLKKIQNNMEIEMKKRELEMLAKETDFLKQQEQLKINELVHQ
jgi:hypothetical protein